MNDLLIVSRVFLPNLYLYELNQDISRLTLEGIFLTCSSHLHLFCNEVPRRLCCAVSLVAGLCLQISVVILIFVRKQFSNYLFYSLNLAFHFFSQLLIFCGSEFSIIGSNVRVIRRQRHTCIIYK